MTGPRTDDVSWLVQEISDDLDAGRVGLYEFVWTLRGRFPQSTDEEFRPVAAAALEELLLSQDVRLVWLTWPNSGSYGEASRADVTDASWDDIGDGPYLGLIRA